METEGLKKIVLAFVGDAANAVHQVGGGVDEQVQFIRELRQELEFTELRLMRFGHANSAPNNVIPFRAAAGDRLH